jgi:hypothetical protein
MDIRHELERIHAAKIAGKPLMHCLRDVVYVSARIHGAAKLSGDEIRERATQTAWIAAVEYGWVITAVERATARSFLRTYAAQWTEEALSGEPDNPPSPSPVPQPILEAAPTPDTSPPELDTSPPALLARILSHERISIDQWARDHRIGRASLMDWKAAGGKPVPGRVSTDKAREIETAILSHATALGLIAQTDSNKLRLV